MLSLAVLEVPLKQANLEFVHKLHQTALEDVVLPVGGYESLNYSKCSLDVFALRQELLVFTQDLVVRSCTLKHV